MYYWNYGIHITCLYLSEALSGFYASSHPRLRSLRSLSLGILRTSLSEAISHCYAWRMGINPTPTLCSAEGIKKGGTRNLCLLILSA